MNDSRGAQWRSALKRMAHWFVKPVDHVEPPPPATTSMRFAPPKSLRDQVVGYVVLAAGLIFLAGVGVIGWQGLHWLQTGTHHPVSALDLAADLEIAWTTQPHSWLGLWKVLDAVNGGAFLIALSFAILFVISP